MFLLSYHKANICTIFLYRKQMEVTVLPFNLQMRNIGRSLSFWLPWYVWWTTFTALWIFSWKYCLLKNIFANLFLLFDLFISHYWLSFILDVTIEGYLFCEIYSRTAHGLICLGMLHPESDVAVYPIQNSMFVLLSMQHVSWVI